MLFYYLAKRFDAEIRSQKHGVDVHRRAKAVDIAANEPPGQSASGCVGVETSASEEAAVV